MQIKRYRCNDVREALRRIRDDLGPNAVVVATRELSPERFASGESGGRRGRPLIEVVAAVDREPEREVSASIAPRWARDVLHIAGVAERHSRELLAAALGAAGPSAADDELRVALTDAIASRIHTVATPWHDEAESAVFLGFAGVGKSTTIAKIAAIAAYAEGARVAIVTTDTDRPGTTARIEALAQAMDIPVLRAGSPWQARALRPTLDRFDRVLIDTPPTTPSASSLGSDPTPLAATLDVLTEGRRTQRYLCVEATATLDSARRAAERCGNELATALIVTKLDAGPGRGAAYSIHRELGRPLALLSIGPRVPDDVEAAHAEVMAQTMLKSSLVAATDAAATDRIHAEAQAKEVVDERGRTVA